MVELVGKIYRCEFFHHICKVFDGVVVIMCFMLDIMYISREDVFNDVGFLILLWLWRMARIINDILVTIKTCADFQHNSNSELGEHELQEHDSRLLVTVKTYTDCQHNSNSELEEHELQEHESRTRKLMTRKYLP